MPRPTPEPVYAAALRSRDEVALLGIVLAGMCGLRRGELARCKREHVVESIELHGDGRPVRIYELRVIGKGGHERYVPLPPMLARLMLERPPGWIFPSSHGGHLTPAHLAKRIARQLPEGYTTHNLRHPCGTVALIHSKDLRAVQELLGHAKPETTAIYTQVSSERVRAAVMHAAAEPAA